MAAVRTHLLFEGELNDFLPPAKRHVRFDQFVGSTDTLKHVIESLHVPHTEVGRVDVNGHPANLNHRLAEDDDVEIFPHQLPITFAEHPKFVVDGHLGRLAAYLRMLGFDTWYERLADDPQLATISSHENRVLLTRDIGLLKRREVEHGYSVRADKPHDQLREVVRRFALNELMNPFTLCMECNGILSSVKKSEITDLLPPHTRQTKNEFSRCTECSKIFWRGSHHARMLGWIQNLYERPEARRDASPCTDQTPPPKP